MEDQALLGHLGFEHFDEVPRDRFSLAVFIGREIDDIHSSQLFLQLGNLFFLLRRDDIDGFELRIDIDAQARPRLLLDVGWDLLGGVRQVTNVADAGLDNETLGQEVRDGPRLRGRFDDDQGLLVGGYHALSSL